MDRPAETKICECGWAMDWFGDHWVCVNIKRHDQIVHHPRPEN